MSQEVDTSTLWDLGRGKSLDFWNSWDMVGDLPILSHYDMKLTLSHLAFLKREKQVTRDARGISLHSQPKKAYPRRFLSDI